ncbi:MAG: hypothetical protein JST52_00685 [Bacteroidetes bacterium]|nr:hypothetical protein [Bacteroidota bacterium]MBS1740316.1 hypothetical protein [Bacteroidota bacterium]MBS1776863.1 hypothetical protein [Bacteroidota bacterium]
MIKSKNKYGFSGLLILLIIAGVISCETQRDPCLQPVSVYMRVRSVKALSDTTVADSLLPNPRWIAIDSQVALVFSKQTASFLLPLNPASDSARFALQPDSSILMFDTLTFFYDRKLNFISNACGYCYFFGLHSISTTKHVLDSVRIRNTDVNGNVNTPDHVQVFF